jgi:hypothetical protein
MRHTKRTIRQVALGTVALALVAIGADTPTQTIDAKDVSFKAPATWKSVKPSNMMRLAQLQIKPVEGDEDQAELLVFGFPGGAGTVETNLSRWQAFFVDDDGKQPKIQSKTVKANGLEVTRAETSGRYVASVRPGSSERHNKPGYHLLGAIAQSGDTAYFWRLIGPEKTVLAARPAFDELIASIKVKKP